jgi:hypothetical protein
MSNAGFWSRRRQPGINCLSPNAVTEQMVEEDQYSNHIASATAGVNADFAIRDLADRLCYYGVVISPDGLRRYHLSMKRPVPVTSCTSCGNAGYNLTLANGRCGKKIDGERCKGTNSSAASDGDWQECAACQGIGVERNAPCSQCRGVGWQLARKPK